MRKLLIVNGSPRQNGTTAAISDMISDCVKKYNYETEIVNICSLEINGCKACLACKKSGKCAQKDDMTQIYEKIRSSDMIIVASPVYFGAETGQMKCFLDRFYAMVNNKDGVRTTDIDKVSKASVLLVCGAPDGYMKYGGVLARMTNMLRSFNIMDLNGTVIGGVGPDQVKTSDLVKDYIDGIEFQVEM